MMSNLKLVRKMKHNKQLSRCEFCGKNSPHMVHSKCIEEYLKSNGYDIVKAGLWIDDVFKDGKKR